MRFIRPTVAILIGLLIAQFSGLPGYANKVRPMNLEQIVEGAETIFEGECTAIRTGKDPDTKLIATWFTFRITNGIKGKLGEEYVLKQYGGSDGTTQVQAPSIRYKVGEKVILFLYGTSRLGFSSAVGLSQGKFSIKEIPETSVRYATNGMPSMILFENMETAPPALNAKGIKAQGQEILRSEKLDINLFIAEIKRLVQLEELKNKDLKKQ